MNPAPYRVVWKRSATEIQLATIVLDLYERGHPVEPVTRAMARLEQLLALDPNSNDQGSGCSRLTQGECAFTGRG